MYKAFRSFTLSLGASCQDSIDQFQPLVQKYKERADFVTVYVAEAHPTDGWALPGMIRGVTTHGSIEERRAAAESMVQDKGFDTQSCPVFLESMEDESVAKYSARPERLLIINDGQVRFNSRLLCRRKSLQKDSLHTHTHIYI